MLPNNVIFMNIKSIINFYQTKSSKMGCINSSPGLPLNMPNATPSKNYNNPSTTFYQMQNRKRPKFLNAQELPQPQKDILWTIIQKNQLKEFAYYLQAQTVPSNIEIGPINTFWNFAHFCCRWDAFECLHYIIKRVYSENRSSQLSLLNQQSIEGYTPLHVAIQWNSTNCFYILLDCGGVDMSYKDNANNDVFTKANLFKRTQMLQVLNKFQAGDALMVLVQTDRVRQFQTFSQMAAQEQPQPLKQYRLTNQRIDYIVDSKNRFNRPPPPPPPLVQKNNQQDYQKAMKKIQQQKNSATQTSEEGLIAINQRKFDEQRRFQQEDAHIKKQQSEEIRKRIQFQKQQQLKCLQAEKQQKIIQQHQFQQAEIARIEKQKEIIKKNIQAMHSSSKEAKLVIMKGTKMVCPEDIKPQYEAALAKKTKFVDQQFPANNQSLGNIANFNYGWEDCTWLRPEKIFGEKFEVFDGISPDDVKQGTLAVCYYLALLSSISEFQKRIKKVFRFYDKDLGFYAVQLYMEGKPTTIIVDDQVPCLKGRNQPLFAKPNGAQTWVMILEKAWVKLFGSYLSAQKMSPGDMFQNVLPSPCRSIIIDISQIDKFYDQLVEYDKKDYIMTTSSLSGVQVPAGIIQQHSYSLIGVYNVNGIKICKLRNPWGKTEYSGMYSQFSNLWTSELKQAVGFKEGDDGIFFLTSTQLQSIMPYVAISMYRNEYEYSWIQIHSRSDEYVNFIVNVKKLSEIVIKITQLNERFRKNIEYENSPVRIQLIRLGQGYQAQFISEGEPSSMYHGCANLFSTEDIYENLQPGRYLIRIKVLYDRTFAVSTRGTYRKFIRGTDGKNILKVRQDKSVLSIYGPQIYVFNKISEDEAMKYMKNAYCKYIKTTSKFSERMRSVGQDLQPMVIAKDCRMKNQIIYYAENFLPKNSINFTFKFDHKKFRNCSYAFNVDKEKQCCEWIIQPGGWNLATLQVDCPFQQIASEAEMRTDFKIIR